MAQLTDTPYTSRSGPRDRSLRVGDRERDAVGEILRRRHVEGRLDTDELETRLERCMTAKTYGQLDELIADFPDEGEDRPHSRQTSSRRPAWSPVFLFAPAAVIAAIAFGGHVAFLAVPLFFFFVVRPLVWHTRAGYRHSAWGRGPR